MDYTPEQRAIIARMSGLSTRYNAAVARQRDAQARAGQTMIDAVPGARRRVSRVSGLAVRLELEVETADLAGPRAPPSKGRGQGTAGQENAMALMLAKLYTALREAGADGQGRPR